MELGWVYFGGIDNISYEDSVPCVKSKALLLDQVIYVQAFL